MTQAEFNEKLEALAAENWKVKSLLKSMPFEEWPAHLQQDAYRRMGVRPVTTTTYEPVA